MSSAPEPPKWPMSSPVTGILQRALANLRSAWRSISQSGRASAPTLQADLPDEDAEVLRQQMRECLEGKGGEVSARARAAALGHSYLNLNDRGRKRFLQILAKDFDVDWKALHASTRDLLETDTLEHTLETEARLRDVLTPRRLKLLTQFNSLPAGVKFLVDLRDDLLRYRGTDLRLRSLDEDLKGLLASWFDIGFLDLKRITWDAPAALLERLIAYEAVHEIESWDDLKNRLGGDRRCYAFFHPRMPDEPLIFVEVALVSGMSDSIQALLDQTAAHRDAAAANTAIFYSISNTQKGLQGVNFGSFLIKRVVDRLAEELPNLQTFATLSPIPDFGRYLRAQVSQEGDLPLTPSEREELGATAGVRGNKRSFSDLLSTPHWHQDRGVADALRRPLMRLCARYLVRDRDKGRAMDRVANFHLSNGARIERINWLADVSPKGLDQSAGLMINYLYELGDIEENHETYRASGEATASAAVRQLLVVPD